MTKEEFLKKFTNKDTGKLELPYGFVMNEPYGQKSGIIGIYQEDDKTWRVYKIGLPDPYGSGEAYQNCTLFQGHNADKAFSIFYNFIIGKENLDTYQIVVDKYMPVSYYLGVYKRKDAWIIYEVGERNNVDIMYEEVSEDKIFDEFYQEVLERLHILGYVTINISKQVIQTSEEYVCDFLQKKYSISKFDAKDLWNDLKYDFHVLNEVKYFALNDKFVPEDDCYKVEGYSARDIYEKTYLTKIGAFDYLIYLKEDPEQALEDLKNGLPIK